MPVAAPRYELHARANGPLDPIALKLDNEKTCCVSRIDCEGAKCRNGVVGSKLHSIRNSLVGQQLQKVRKIGVLCLKKTDQRAIRIAETFIERLRISRSNIENQELERTPLSDLG